MKTVYDYLPFNLDKLNEMTMVNYLYPKTEDTIDNLLNVAFLLGYNKGSFDADDNLFEVLKEENIELYNNVKKALLKYSIKKRLS